MSILSDREIRERCNPNKKGGPMIEPFVAQQIKERQKRLPSGWPPDVEKIISYGLSSYGYDLRVSNEFKIFTNVYTSVIDPKNFDERNFVDVVENDFCIIPPNSFALAKSIETFRIPRDIITLCLGKSTYARCGIIVNVTPFEPGWEGVPTLEISNTTPLPAKIYAYEGLAQVLFFRADIVCELSYADKKGKYQGQTGITLPK